MGAAVAFPASAASAGTIYNSTATGTAGQITIAGTAIPLVTSSVTATDQASPVRASLGIAPIEKALSGTPLAGVLKAALPTGLDVTVASATANKNGTSSACAGFVAGDCTPSDKPQPITLSLSLADLPGLNVPTGGGASSAPSSPSDSKTSSTKQSGPLSGITKSIEGKSSGSKSTSSKSASTSSPAGSSGSGGSTPTVPLSDFRIVLTVSGPEAACTAGPEGGSGSDFTAYADLAKVGLDIQENGKSVLGGPIGVDAGDLLGQLNKVQLPAQLTQALGGSTLPTGAIGLKINPGSTTGAGSGPVTTATAGEVELSIGQTDVLHLVGAKATCGANKPAATTKKSGEQPLTGIQTDEGRSGFGATALWLGVSGGVALAGTAGGVTFWRRRRS